VARPGRDTAAPSRPTAPPSPTPSPGAPLRLTHHEPNRPTTLISSPAVRAHCATLPHAPASCVEAPPPPSRTALDHSEAPAEPRRPIPTLASAPAAEYRYCGARGPWTLFDPMSRPRRAKAGLNRDYAPPGRRIILGTLDADLS
jgi:hypothetical protein